MSPCDGGITNNIGIQQAIRLELNGSSRPEQKFCFTLLPCSNSRLSDLNSMEVLGQVEKFFTGAGRPEGFRPTQEIIFL
jgi:hypothetical protein